MALETVATSIDGYGVIPKIQYAYSMGKHLTLVHII